jgi:hypothetical protein
MGFIVTSDAGTAGAARPPKRPTRLMTVSSMTGFALARRDHRTGAIVLEIRSVNSRYLDPQFRLSDELRAGEASLR